MRNGDAINIQDAIYVHEYYGFTVYEWATIVDFVQWNGLLVDIVWWSILREDISIIYSF